MVPPLETPAAGPDDPLALAASLRLFVSRQCPFCGRARMMLESLAAAHENLRLDIVDVHQSPNEAEKHDVRAVPTLQIDDRWRLIGTISRDDVVQLIAQPTRLGAVLLRRLIEQGNADALVAAMCERRALPITIVELLVDPTMGVRLGAMAVIEKTADRDRELAAHVIDPLWLRFDEVDDTVRGDILYLIGEVGDASHLPLVQAVLEGPFSEDVIEAAREAADALDPNPFEEPGEPCA
jgi:glutaredoxin